MGYSNDDGQFFGFGTGDIRQLSDSDPEIRFDPEEEEIEDGRPVVGFSTSPLKARWVS